MPLPIALLDTTTLWRELSDRAFLDRTIGALYELAERGEDLSEFIVMELSRPRPARQWSHALVFAAEKLRQVALSWRTHLVQTLLDQAHRLDTGEEADGPPLWSAMRSFGRYACISDVPRLSPFLMSAHPATCQAAAQACQAILAGEPLVGVDGADDIRQALRHLTTTFLDDDLRSPQNLSLAANCLGAALLADVPGWPDLLEKAVSTGHKMLIAICKRIVAEGVGWRNDAAFLAVVERLH